MRVEGAVFGAVGLVLAPWAIVYLATADEPAGEAGLVLAAVSLLFVSVYLLVKSRSVGPRPEDDRDGEPVEGDDLGVYPSSSIWPFTLAIAVTVIAYGLAFTVWIALPGVALFTFAVVAWALEVQRSRA